MVSCELHVISHPLYYFENKDRKKRNSHPQHADVIPVTDKDKMELYSVVNFNLPLRAQQVLTSFGAHLCSPFVSPKLTAKFSKQTLLNNELTV